MLILVLEEGSCHGAEDGGHGIANIADHAQPSRRTVRDENIHEFKQLV